jgi:hypothetical protein
MAGRLILFAVFGAWLVLAAGMGWGASCGTLDLETPGVLLGEAAVRWVVGGSGRGHPPAQPDRLLTRPACDGVLAMAKFGGPREHRPPG